MRQTHFSVRARAAVVAMVVISFAALARAGEERIYTDRDFAKELFADAKHTTVDAYKQVGKRDAKWDKQAIEFLDAMSARMTNGFVGRLNWVPALPADQLAALGRAAIDAGCDDPLVLDVYSMVLNDTNKKEEATKICRAQLDGLKARHYPAIRIFSAVRRAHNTFDSQRQMVEYAKYHHMLAEALGDWSNSPDSGGIERRVMFAYLRDDAFEIESFKTLADVLKAPGADPWLSNVLLGDSDIHQMDATAYDPSDRDPNAGAKRDQLHAHAKECFTKAFEIQPNYPEPAALMMSIAMAEGGARDGSVKTWFDRATQAQFDYRIAYDQLLFAQQPRWGGSLDQMLQTGMDCAATHRYDTEVPMYLDEAMEDIVYNRNGLTEYFDKPGVYPALKEMYVAMAKNAPVPELSDKILGKYAAIAYRTNHYDDLREALAQMKKPHGNDARDGAASRGGLMVRLFQAAAAVNEKTEPAIFAAEKVADTWDMLATVAAYKPLIERGHKDPLVVEFMRNRSAEMAMRASLNTNSWTDITPNADLDGYIIETGDWKMNGKILENTSNGIEPSRILITVPLQRRIEIRFKVKIVGLDKADAAKNPANNPGAVIYLADMVHWQLATVLHPLTTSADFMQTIMGALHQFGNVKAENDVAVRIWEENFQLMINGEEFFQNVGWREDFRRTDALFGFGGTAVPAGVKFQFSDIQAKLLEVPWKKFDE